jgi:CRISPR-associated endonuclease/helicase Cas3
MEISRALSDDVAEEEGPSVRYWYVRPQSADDDGSRFALFRQPLDSHSRFAGELMARLVAALRLEPGVASALTEAAVRHDDGKQRELWQRSIGNRNYPQEVLAKSDSRNGILLTTGYRHELGSLTALARAARLEERGTDDLVNQAIGAHHGRCRPHFGNSEAFDPECEPHITDAIVREAPRRFARMQRQFGRWGLAYLESLLRAVDGKASEPPSGTATTEAD